MFELELLLKSVQVMFSKDAREAVGSVASALKSAPHWKDELLTFGIAVSENEREKIDLSQDLIVQKLEDHKYPIDAIDAFATTFRELIQNGFDHGTKRGARQPIKITTDICKTYVSVTVANARGHSVDLPAWIEKAKDHMLMTKKAERGRGLQMVYSKADILVAEGKESVKGIVYFDRVEVMSLDQDGTVILVPISGLQNPSVGRRLIEAIARENTFCKILCLDLKQGAQLLNLSEIPVSPGRSSIDSKSLHTLVSYMGWLSNSGTASVRLVIDDSDILDLLPADAVFRSISEARAAIRRL